MRFVLVVSLLTFVGCGIKGNPRPPKVTFVADDAPDAGCCTEASQGTRSPASASGRDEGDAKQSPSAAQTPTSNTGASQGTRSPASASGPDEGDAKQSPSAAETPTRNTETVK